MSLPGGDDFEDAVRDALDALPAELHHFGISDERLIELGRY